jgi:hypothetical protein
MADQKADKNVVTWVIAGQRYDVDLFDIDGMEWRDAKRATGMSQNAIVFQALDAKDFESIAVLIWIWRRRTEPDLAYESVLKGLSFGVLGFDDDDDEGTTADPPD